ncbi:hypothetical protein NDU88_008624 [Pleurodeles waltl]|uniref:Uncharacterized protein n=1 Tax=Pleurodeles waltl TaxID=8319 RepID=A0AAV7PTF9_PLEWA|nr:hypothetical protein NDU88_008624 [Pleurodeles waltl]
MSLGPPLLHTLPKLRTARSTPGRCQAGARSPAPSGLLHSSGQPRLSQPGTATAGCPGGGLSSQPPSFRLPIRLGSFVGPPPPPHGARLAGVAPDG